MKDIDGRDWPTLKISELIEKLTELQEEHGDLPVFREDYHAKYPITDAPRVVTLLKGVSTDKPFVYDEMWKDRYMYRDRKGLNVVILS